MAKPSPQALDPIDTPLAYAALWPSAQVGTFHLAASPQDSQTTGVMVSLINYSNLAMTQRCIEALAQQTALPAWVVVVDNSPTEDDYQALDVWQRTTPLPFNLILLRSPYNGGFSAANNMAIRVTSQQCASFGHAPPQYVWILNNDTQPEPDALAVLLATLQHPPDSLFKPNAAIVGSCLRDIDESPLGAYQGLGSQINRWTGSIRGILEPKSSAPFIVDTLCGASILIPTGVLRTIGLWDVPYFLYWEDVAFSLRASQAGYPCVAVTQSVVRHASNGTTGRWPSRRDYYFYRNRLHAIRQCYGNISAITALLYGLWRGARFGISFLFATGAKRQHKAQAGRIFWRGFTDALAGRWGACPAEL